MSTDRTDLVGPQPTDPPWARLLFMLLIGRDGQCWRAVLLLTPLLLLVAGVVLVATTAPGGWIGGVLGFGSLTALAMSQRHKRRPH
ncbi:MAG: hypothetical protein LC808_33555 [Actinobacteria bacterium]|nr:hypothetical protein [Actinomycetota bacterium]